MVQSMSRRANIWNNAVAESFFRSLKVDAINGIRFDTRLEAERRAFDYIENFYNTKRLHPFLLYKSPSQWEFETIQNPGLILLRQN